MLVVVRHGQSQANEEGLIAGHIDPPLTALGERQAIALQEELAGVELVVASPLSRARRTGELAAPGREVIVSPDFIELDYGRFDGRRDDELTREDWDELAGRYDHEVGGGESLAQLDLRVHEALHQLAREHGDLVASADRHLAVLTHASPVKSAAAWALGVHGSVAWRMRSDNCAMTTITWRGGSPYLLSHNVTVRPR
jgi:probable phosphoglycerate mutase